MSDKVVRQHKQGAVAFFTINLTANLPRNLPVKENLKIGAVDCFG